MSYFVGTDKQYYHLIALTGCNPIDDIYDSPLYIGDERFDAANTIWRTLKDVS